MNKELNETIYVMTKDQIKEALSATEPEHLIEEFINDLDVMCNFGSILGIYKNDDKYFTYKRRILQEYKDEWGIEYLVEKNDKIDYNNTKEQIN